MAKMKLKKGDKVVVRAGKDKGKRGKVLQVNADGRLLVQGVNIIKKHTRANPQAGIAGGIVEKEAPIQVSNVAIFNPKTEKADRVGFREENGKKVRFYKSNGEVVGA